MTSPDGTRPFGAQLLGETEKALNAILRRELSGTGVTEPQWVTLTITAVSDGRLDAQHLVLRVAGGLRVDPEQAGQHISELTTAGLLHARENGGAVLTAEGHALWTRVRANTLAITQGLWGDLPSNDLEVAARVLATVLTRADLLLGGA
jgi:hypothetical protein